MTAFRAPAEHESGEPAGRCAIMSALRMTVVAGGPGAPARIGVRLALVAIGCLAAVLLAPVAARAAALPPAPVVIASGWEMHPDPTFRGEAEGWQTGSEHSGWAATTVPGVYDPQALPSQFAGTVQWYRVTFDGPKTPTGFAWGLK